MAHSASSRPCGSGENRARNSRRAASSMSSAWGRSVASAPRRSASSGSALRRYAWEGKKAMKFPFSRESTSAAMAAATCGSVRSRAR